MIYSDGRDESQYLNQANDFALKALVFIAVCFAISIFLLDETTGAIFLLQSPPFCTETLAYEFKKKLDKFI